jgi:hypothetical protein
MNAERWASFASFLHVLSSNDLDRAAHMAAAIAADRDRVARQASTGWLTRIPANVASIGNGIYVRTGRR